jgi:hypothetical protein
MKDNAPILSPVVAVEGVAVSGPDRPNLLGPLERLADKQRHLNDREIVGIRQLAIQSHRQAHS